MAGEQTEGLGLLLVKTALAAVRIFTRVAQGLRRDICMYVCMCLCTSPPDPVKDRIQCFINTVVSTLDASRVNSGRERSAKNRLGSGSRGTKPRSALADGVDEPFTIAGQKNIGKWLNPPGFHKLTRQNKPYVCVLHARRVVFRPTR